MSVPIHGIDRRRGHQRCCGPRKGCCALVFVVPDNNTCEVRGQRRRPIVGWGGGGSRRGITLQALHVKWATMWGKHQPVLALVLYCRVPLSPTESSSPQFWYQSTIQLPDSTLSCPAACVPSPRSACVKHFLSHNSARNSTSPLAPTSTRPRHSSCITYLGLPNDVFHRAKGCAGSVVKVIRVTAWHKPTKTFFLQSYPCTLV